MNKKQEIVMWVAIAVISAICLFSVALVPEGVPEAIIAFILLTIPVMLISGGFIYQFRTKEDKENEKKDK